MKKKEIGKSTKRKKKAEDAAKTSVIKQSKRGSRGLRTAAGDIVCWNQELLQRDQYLLPCRSKCQSTMSPRGRKSIV